MTTTLYLDDMSSRDLDVSLGRLMPDVIYFLVFLSLPTDIETSDLLRD